MSKGTEGVTDGSSPTHIRPKRGAGKTQAAEQPFEYPLRREYVEPDWTRLPGYADVTRDEWESAKWQRSNSVKKLAEFKRVLGDHLGDDLCADMERDQRERATMSMLIPPHMINTMDESDLRDDPVRRYMAPAFSERDSGRGRATRWRRATPSTRPRCGRSKASPTAIPPRSSPR